MSTRKHPWVDAGYGFMMPEAAVLAFETYYAMGADRTLDRMPAAHADPQTGKRWTIGQYRTWCHKYKWIDLIGRRMQDRIAAEREAARKTHAELAAARIRRAAELQDRGMLILERAEIDELEPEQARELIGQATRLVELGMKMERLELGEATEITSIRPPKPVKEMNDEELAAWREHLEQLRAATP